MSVETLENLLKNPDIWDISLSTQNMHDVLVEIASRVDALMANQDKNKVNNNDNEQQVLDINDFASRIDALSKQLDRQNTDFGSEIQDLRALFNFQIRDVREKMDRNLTNIKDSMSRPSTPPSTVIQQIPDTDANFELERKVHTLSKDISYLKDRIRAILTTLKDLPELQNKQSNDDENQSLEKKENKTELDATSSNKLLLDNEPDVDLLSHSSRLNQDDPLSPNETPFTSGINDSRFDGIVEDIEFMKKERKNDTDRLNSTIKAVNQLIAEKDNSTNKINQCVRDSKRFGDEFDRLYEKMAEFQVEVEKKISEALNIRINSDIKSIPTSSNDHPLELPHFKEGISDDIAQLDSSYKQQINYLKLEIAELRQALSDKMLPNSISNPFSTSNEKGSISRSDVYVQTDESLTDEIPTRHANVDVQKTRVANEIMTQVIVSRTPIQFMAINQEYANLIKFQQPSPQQQAQNAEKPKPTKRTRKPVSTNSIEIQTNNENSKDQSELNQPNEDDPRNISSSSSSQSKADSRSKKMRSSHSSRKVTYIDSTTETQAELSGIASPLRTPPRTPLRSQNQKRKGQLIDILIETDPEITGEPLGITPDLLEPQESSRVKSDKENEYDSEEEDTSKQSEPNSTTKVDAGSDENTENAKKDKKRRKKKKGKIGKDSQSNESQDLQNNQKDSNQQKVTLNESAQVDNAETEIRSKTPQPKSDNNKVSSQIYQNKEVTDQDSTKTDDQKISNDQQSLESQDKVGTPQTETPKEIEPAKPEKDDTNDESTNKNIKKKKEKVIYADSGISTQINTYEKEIIVKDDQDGEEVEVVDIQIQTDEISEEELSMYSIFNQEDPDLLKELDLSYMEKYSTSGSNTRGGIGNQNRTSPKRQAQNTSSKSPYFMPQQPIFSFEHLLSLTIISEPSNPGPQNIIYTTPESSSTASTSDGAKSATPKADINSIVKQVLQELNKDKNYDVLSEHVNKHTEQIGNIFGMIDDIRNSNPDSFKGTGNGDASESNKNSNGSREQRAGSEHNNKRNYSTLSPVQQHQSKQQQQQQQQQASNQQQQQQQIQKQPVNSNSNCTIVIADLTPDPQITALIQNCGKIPEEVNERLDSIDDSIADLEDHVFALEKKLIDKGALRPNSANPYGEDNNPFGTKIKIDTSKQQGDVDYYYRERREPRHHHHHHRHDSNKNTSQSQNNEYENGVIPKEKENEDQNKNQTETNNETNQNKDQNNTKGNETNGDLNQEKKEEEVSNKVVAIASGPDKPRSNIFNQFTPGSLSKEREMNAKKESLEFIQGFTIDPDPEAMKPPEQQVVIPEDITLPKYERQLRLLREAVVELRTNIQILRVKTDQPVIIQPTENVEAEPEEKNESTVDESTFRALRKKIELTFEDYSSQIADIRRELYLHLEQPPDRIIELRTEVQTVAKPKEEEEGNDKNKGKPAPQAPKDINVDLNLSKAIEMLADTQHKSVISIHKIELPPEVKEHKDLVQRIQQNNPIIEDALHPNAVKPTSDLLQPPPLNNDHSNGQNAVGQAENDQPIDYSVLPPPASTPLITQVKNEGHLVPQIVQDMRVLNAMPKKDMLELLMPFLYQLRSELLINIDSNAERIRCLENSVQSKVDKEFIESFFRKIRMAVKEADDKAMRACNSLFDKVTKQDLEDRMQELMKQIGTQETTVAGKTSYTCLFCGAKKTVLSKSSIGNDKGKLFKGRTTRQSLQPNELSQLPPLNENE